MISLEDIAATLAADLSIRCVAVDGRTASGKTTFATKLTGRVNDLGRPAIHAQLDGFHNPRSVRYTRGRMSAEGYYRDARDLDAVKRCLLVPFRNGAPYCTEILNLAADTPVEPVWQAPPDRSVLIVDGSFLQRPELSDMWDSVVFLDVDAETSMSRGMGRDGEAMRETYAQRYLPAWDIYLSETDPIAYADWVVSD